MSDAIITLTDAGKSYAGLRVLQQISLSIGAGEAVAILGKNGSGKSTLLKIIGGLVTLTHGKRIVHDGNRRLVIGYVPDRFPKVRMTGMEYLRFMGAISGIPKRRLNERISMLLDQFGLDKEAAMRPSRQYSKGMLQKINVIQAILEQPDMLLLDEPLSGLDSRSQDQLIDVLAELKAAGVSIVLTSHEQGITEKIADRIVAIDGGRVREERGWTEAMAPVAFIVFSLPSGERATEWLSRQGIRNGRETERGLSVLVDAEQSDRFLKAVLDCGGHIVSVGQAETSNRGVGKGGR